MANALIPIKIGASLYPPAKVRGLYAFLRNIKMHELIIENQKLKQMILQAKNVLSIG
jgi:hypothetical protein